MRVFILPFGCSANLSDSEIIAGLLRKEGFEIVEKEEESDLNIIVTCNVKLPTEKRMINEIRKLSKKPLIVAGCMPSTQRDIIEKINPRASLVGPNSVTKIVEAAKKTLEGKKVIFLENLNEPKVCLPRVQKSKVIHITQISTGCNYFCSYCIVRLNKGSLFCFPFDLILKDVKDALDEGKKEIWITSQDNASYEYDGKNLGDLIKEICKIGGKFFVRIGMMNPASVKRFLKNILEAYKNEKVFKFLHLPLQSGSDRILELMNRKYTVKEFLGIVKEFRKKFKEITLATDIIVGFPTEEENDFEKTLKILEKIKFDVVNISKFGPRPGTLASKLKQIDEKIVSERSKRVHELVNEIKLRINERWIGWKGEILIDEKGKDKSFVGRNFCYKPIVLESEKDLVGNFVEVEVYEAKSNYLKGKLL